MTSLTQHDIQRFNQAVLMVYESTTPENFSHNLLTAMRLIVPGDINLVSWSGVSIIPTHSVFDPLDALNPEIFHGLYSNADDHPGYGKLFHEVRSLSDYYTERSWHETGLYAEGYAKVRQEDGLATDCDMGDGSFLSLSVSRSVRGYSEKERLLFALLKPHVQSASRKVVAAYLESMSQGASPLEVGLLDVGSNGRVQHWPLAVRQMFTRYFGDIEVANDFLPGPLLRWFHASYRRWCQRDAMMQPTVYRISRAGHILTVRFSAGLLQTLSGCLLVVEESRPVDHFFGVLTEREKEVLLHVKKGRSNAEIADVLGLKSGTVKRHLENIYAKLGVANRYQAANIIY